MSLNILLVEDDPRVSDFVRRGLIGEGWNVTTVSSGEDALDALDGPGFDLIVLDVLLPGISGHDVCRHLRWREDTTPILMLTALDSTDDVVTGLRRGADDYLAKPFKFDELVARIEALHRRATTSSPGNVGNDILQAAGLTLDRSAMQVSVEGRPLETTARERDLLNLFLTNPNRALSRERILSTVWGESEDPLTNIVDVYIARIRKKLGSHGALIQTVYGVGYRFEPDHASSDVARPDQEGSS